MRKLILIISIVLIETSLSAQLENIPLVTVFGESVIKVKPDYVVLGLKVNKDIKKKLNGEVLSAFEIFDKEDTKVRLFDFEEKNIYESIIQFDSLKYFKEIFIVIRDLNKLDKYLLELYKLGFKDYTYVDYRVNNKNEYNNQARKDAMSVAVKKATMLANEVGQTIGKVHLIEELDYEEYNWYNKRKVGKLEDVTYKLGADNYLIDPGYITITARIRVSFNLNK